MTKTPQQELIEIEEELNLRRANSNNLLSKNPQEELKQIKVKGISFERSLCDFLSIH